MEDDNKSVKQQVKLDVEVPADVRGGEYSNFVRTQHSPFDFIMDFGRVLPDEKKVLIASRIYMSPQHIKLFAMALQRNIENYEKVYGPIPAPKQPHAVDPVDYSKH